jgi:hypothetical protein
MPVLQMSNSGEILSSERVQFEISINRNKMLWGIIILLLFKRI